MARGNEIGVAYYSLVPSMDGTAAAVNSQLGLVTAAGNRAGVAGGTAMGAGLASGLKAAGVIGLALGVAGIAGQVTDYFKNAVGLASDLAESANAINVSFGDAAAGVAALGETAAQRLALSNNAFNALAVRFSSFARTIAGEGGDVVGVIDDLTTRGADFASVYNIEVAEALTLFQSGLAGETEPLRRYGIDLSAAAVEAFALANGIGEQGRALSEAEKVQARYLLLLEQTNQVAGDFANTQDSLANTQKTTNALLEDAQAAIGEAFLPVAQDLATWFLEDGVPLVERFSQVLGENQDVIDGFGDFIQGTFSFVLDDLAFKLAVMSAVTDDWFVSTSEMEQLFYELPQWAQDGFLATANAIFGFAVEYQNRVNGLANGVIGFLNTVIEAGMTAGNFLRNMFGLPSVSAALIPYLGTAAFTPLSASDAFGSQLRDGDRRGGGGAIPRGDRRGGGASFATGGYVPAQPGGVFGQIGEGRHDEVVLPLSDQVFRELGAAIGGGDRPIYMDGSIVGVLREVANREAELVLSSAVTGLGFDMRAGGVV